MTRWWLGVGVLGVVLPSVGVLGCGAAPNPAPADKSTAADALVGAETAVGTDSSGDGKAPAPSKKPPACPAAAAAVACYHKCAPAENAKSPAEPPPALCGDGFSGLLWATADGKAPTPPTLVVELGAGDVDSGACVPYTQGQWAPIVEGVQGGVHVWAAVRLALPAGTPPKLTLEVAGHALIDCQVVATELAGTSKAIGQADPSKAGMWHTAKAAVPGVPVAFEKNLAAPYCGKWLQLVVEVRDPQSQAWGVASQLLRLYDLDNLGP